MKQITKQELIDLINEVKGVTFVSVDIESEPRMRKTDNPYMGATKQVSLSGAVNYDYGHSVNLQLDREDKEANFQVQKRAWGEHVDNWVVHKGNHYLPIKIENASDPTYVYDGEEVNVEELKPFLYESKKPKTQEDVTKEIIVRDVKIDSIKHIRAFGDEFEVV